METNFRIMWKALVNAYDAGWDLVVVNLLWFVLSIPIITLPATMAGMAYYAHELAHNESVTWRDFFVGMKKYFWPSMRFLLLNLVIFFLMLFYRNYFDGLNVAATPYVVSLVYGLGIIWLLLMPYVFPLMLEQKKPGLRDGLRNSLVMYVKWPGLALPVVILVYLLIYGSSVVIIPFTFLTISLCSFLLAYVAMVKAEESAAQALAKAHKGTEAE